MSNSVAFIILIKETENVPKVEVKNKNRVTMTMIPTSLQMMR